MLSLQLNSNYVCWQGRALMTTDSEESFRVTLITDFWPVFIPFYLVKSRGWFGLILQPAPSFKCRSAQC